MKRSRSNVIFVIVVILAILDIAAFYIYDVFYITTSYTTNLFRVLAAILVMLGTFIRLLSSRGRKRLDVYEGHMKKNSVSVQGIIRLNPVNLPGHAQLYTELPA